MCTYMCDKKRNVYESDANTASVRKKERQKERKKETMNKEMD